MILELIYTSPKDEKTNIKKRSIKLTFLNLVEWWDCSFESLGECGVTLLIDITPRSILIWSGSIC